MSTFRIGHGYDIHRLQAGGRLHLGGVVVEEHLSAVAHSDGDVVLHAIVDALFGAIGAGDIGEQFPDSDPTWRDASSAIFVEKALVDVREAGFSVENVDVTVLAERPRLSPHKQAMCDRLAKLLGTSAVNVKAGTNESMDAVGRGEAIAAHAVVLLKRDS